MTVHTHIPAAGKPPLPSLTFTPRALAKAEKELASRVAAALRLTIKQSGCSGYRYLLDFVEAPAADDVTLTISDTLTLYVSKEAAAMVNGTEIDYVTEGLNSSFQFRNPNATGQCGCGESFTVN